MDKIQLYNRKAGLIEEEQVFEQGFMSFFYGVPVGRLIMQLFLKRKWFSMLYGVLKRKVKTKSAIQLFVENYQIDITEIEKPIDSFENFNAFFARQLKPGARPITKNKATLISPADGRLCIYKIDNHTVLPVKGKHFTLSELLQNDPLASQYEQGTCVVIRLAPVDYHRFCFIDAGTQTPIKTINGFYHSVSPLSLIKKLPVFTENKREYCLLKTHHFGDVIEVDVGALVVGHIQQNFRQGAKIAKGQEKGWFEFGGSTIILIFKQNTIQIDADIIKQSTQGIETLVQYGEAIGSRITS